MIGSVVIRTSWCSKTPKDQTQGAMAGRKRVLIELESVLQQVGYSSYNSKTKTQQTNNK